MTGCNMAAPKRLPTGSKQDMKPRAVDEGTFTSTQQACTNSTRDETYSFSPSYRITFIRMEGGDEPIQRDQTNYNMEKG